LTLATQWPFDTVTGAELVIAWVDHLAMTTFTLVEKWLRNVSTWNSDTFAVINIGDTAFTDGVGYGLFNLLFIATDEPLPVHRAFVFAI